MPAGPSRLALAADHGGFALKQELASWLRGLGHVVEDLGVHNAEPADYPDTALALARRVASHGADLGIVLDAAGNGSAITANKVPGIRAAVGYTVASARSSREHNDANVLALAAAGLTFYEARAIVAAWLESRFAGGRHQRRVDKIGASEAKPQTPAPGVTALPRDQYAALVDRISSLIEPPPAPAAAPPRAAPAAEPLRGTIPPEPPPASAAAWLELGACRLSACPPAPQLEAGLAAFIDHTLLKPEATRDEILQLCREAREYGFASVCVNPAWTALAATELRGSPVLVCTVIGFPLGAGLTTVKRFEASECLKLGADELDMVLNVGALKSGLDDLVREDIRALAALCHDACARLKVILETALLTDAEKVRACQLAQAAGADFVKTSTGFSSGGATAADVALMRATVGDCMGVKASGGVRDREAALAMIEAGATRLGASASVRIVTAAAAGASSGY